MAKGDGMRAPIRVWRYRDWCAICVPCNRAIAISEPTRDDAMDRVDEHIGRHRRNRLTMPVLRRIAP